MTERDALTARVRELEKALRRIAGYDRQTRTISDPTSAFIDGKEATVTYVEPLTARAIARAALDAKPPHD